MASHALRQRLLLFRRAKLKELLDDVVAKDISHETVRCLQDLLKNHGLLLVCGALQLLLDEPAHNIRSSAPMTGTGLTTACASLVREVSSISANTLADYEYMPKLLHTHTSTHTHTLSLSGVVSVLQLKLPGSPNDGREDSICSHFFFIVFFSRKV